MKTEQKELYHAGFKAQSSNLDLENEDKDWNF
jgi:hypothetical protein